MLNKIVVIIKLFCCILFFSQNIFAQSDIITKNFDGQIDDNIKSYYYDHKTTSLFYLNSSLQLNIIDFKSNKIKIIQLSTENNFLSNVPINWVPNVALNANKELINSQLKTQLHQKISESTPLLSSNRHHMQFRMSSLQF